MFRDHHMLIWRTLRRFGMTEDGAADGTQQAFLIAAERLDQIRLGSERAFLFGTAIRLARSSHRKNYRCQLEADMDTRADPKRGDDDAANRRIAVELLDRVLRRMDEDLVTVFVLFELEGMSTPEIAELVQIPVGTAASRLRRARQAFRAAAVRLERSAAPQRVSTAPGSSQGAISQPPAPRKVT
jgi:RNA polymerase sigma-70 factor (ECF subfamily)